MYAYIQNDPTAAADALVKMYKEADEARLEDLPVDRLVNDPVDALADLWHSLGAPPGQRAGRP